MDSELALDILRAADRLPSDKLHDVLKNNLLDERTKRLFAVWCARQSLAQYPEHDPRSARACDVAERHANGKATDEELEAANREAMAAVHKAALHISLGYYAGPPIWVAYAARDASESSTWAFALFASWNAAGPGAQGRPWDMAWKAQVAKLIQMLESNNGQDA